MKIWIEIIDEDDDGEIVASECVPTVSYEQGAEALARVIRAFERKEVEKQNVIPDNDE